LGKKAKMLTTGKFTDSNGIFWRVEGDISTWPPDARRAFHNTFKFQKTHRHQCDFDIVCPRTGERTYCGGLPPHNKKPIYPMFIIYEMLSRPTHRLADGQLSLFKSNMLYEYAGRLSTKRHYWVSTYSCWGGARRALDRAKVDKDVYQIIVMLYTKRDRKIKSRLITNWLRGKCDPGK
jgi:hypothetical protein